MADPLDALISFQDALNSKDLELQPCKLNAHMHVHADQPTGVMRLTYAMVDKDVVTSLAIFVATEAIDGIPCFQVGYAVPIAYRNRGLAKKIVEEALSEMKQGGGLLSRWRDNHMHQAL